MGGLELFYMVLILSGSVYANVGEQAGSNAVKDTAKSEGSSSNEGPGQQQNEPVNIPTTSRVKVTVPVKNSALEAHESATDTAAEEPFTDSAINSAHHTNNRDVGSQEYVQSVESKETPRAETPDEKNINQPQSPDDNQAGRMSLPETREPEPAGIPSSQSNRDETANEALPEPPNDQDIPEPPDFYEATGIDYQTVSSLRTIREEVAIEHIRKILHVKYKPDSSFRTLTDTYIQKFDRHTRVWSVEKQSSHYTIETPATPPETEDDSMITPDFVQPTFQLEEPAAAEEQSQNTELSDEQKLAKEYYDEGMRLLEARTFSSNKKAYQLFNSASLLDYTPARELMALSYFYGDYVTANISKAHEMFTELSGKGNPRGQLGLGLMYASGIHVNSSQAKALVYMTFSALGDDDLAQMVLGYRYLSGIGVQANCETALIYYSKAAKKVAEKVTVSGGPVVQRLRLSEETDSAGSSSSNLLDEDLIQYYKFLADKGDTSAQVGLAQLYLQGSRGVPIDYKEALHYFRLAAESGNANAEAFIGRMYAEGVGDLKQDYTVAREYFARAAEQDNPIGQAGLGMLYLKGHAVEKDINTAFKYFTKSAEQNWVDGLLHLGIMYYKGIGTRRNYKSALKYFNLASQSGNMLALYNLAQMHSSGAGVMRACHTAVELYKNVAERGPWARLLMEAHSLYTRGYSDVAMRKYLITAELGYEVAQSNVAYILDNGEIDSFQETEMYRRALLQWNRAASQGSTVARIKLGDYHYYGLGTDVDYEQAIQHYRVAGEQQNNAQAMYNLAYMHEIGLGLKQDLHLAKRFYDMAAEASKDAQVPVSLALARLNFFTNVEYYTNMSNLWQMVATFHPQAYLGPSWDMYLITLLGVFLGLLYIIRTHVLIPAR